ncbi:forkhead box protein N1 isoform 1-T2 [Menidia menidia]
MAEYQTIEDRDLCFPQKDGITSSFRTVVPSRRHSADGTSSSGAGPPERGQADRFHPYHRQVSDGAVGASGCVQQCSSSFNSLEKVSIPDTTWEQRNGSNQGSFPELPAVTIETSSFLSQNFPAFNSMSPRQQSVSTQSHQENSTQLLFPKPIYSYSILIFMALRNSKTGSLPVSEIYSFMTEHFPYFKTAPDGWKNSVRHNLSLNKCFEKVENKNGSTSRKGCLWALNPAKVEKMQEELHKWRRKDPLTVRRSMARPEDFDHLLGEKPEKLRSLPPYTSSSRVNPTYSAACAPTQLQAACHPTRCSHHTHVQPQLPYYLPPAAPRPGDSFGPYCPGQQSPSGIKAATGSLDSPLAGKMPPVHCAALQTEYSADPRGMRDMLLDGDTSYDIDTLNPTLTDLQLQSNLWEQLREDSLVSEPHVSTTTSSASFFLQNHDLASSCLHVPAAFSSISAGSVSGCCKAAHEDENVNKSCLSGLYPVAYSEVDCMAGYLTSYTTSAS